MGRELTREELVQATGIKEDHVIAILTASQIQPASLDIPVNGDDEKILEDFIAGTSNVPAEAQQAMLNKDIDEALDILPLRHRRVLELRYGLDDGRSRTLEEVGEELGVTRERARQIEIDALKRLRVLEKSDDSKHLEEYLD